MEVSGQLQALADLPPEKKPLVGLRAFLEEVVRREIPSPYRDSNPRSSSP